MGKFLSSQRIVGAWHDYRAPCTAHRAPPRHSRAGGNPDIRHGVTLAHAQHTAGKASLPVGTPWRPAWVPACAGTTRRRVSIGQRDATAVLRHCSAMSIHPPPVASIYAPPVIRRTGGNPLRPTPSFPRRRESRHSPRRGTGESLNKCRSNTRQFWPLLSRRGDLPGSPPARGRRGGGCQSASVTPLVYYAIAPPCPFTLHSPRLFMHHPLRSTPSFPRRRESRHSPRCDVGSCLTHGGKSQFPRLRRGRRFSPAFPC